MLVKTEILIRGFPIWIELEGEHLQRDPRFHKKMAEEILKMLIKEHEKPPEGY